MLTSFILLSQGNMAAQSAFIILLLAFLVFENEIHIARAGLCTRAAGGRCKETYSKRFCSVNRSGYCRRVGSRCRCVRRSSIFLAQGGDDLTD
jgi:hypothetical protein